MAQLNKKIMAVAVAVVFCLLAAFWPHEREADALKIEQQAVNTASEKEAKITVYVSGAVANPGLHEIAPGSRAVEAIAAAGGMTEEANKDKVNLAKICKDGACRCKYPCKQCENGRAEQRFLQCCAGKRNSFNGQGAFKHCHGGRTGNTAGRWRGNGAAHCGIPLCPRLCQN